MPVALPLLALDLPDARGVNQALSCDETDLFDDAAETVGTTSGSGSNSGGFSSSPEKRLAILGNISNIHVGV
jgi:hypothetical protein